MRRAVLCCTVLGLVLGPPAEPGSEPALVELSPQEQVLLEEVRHLTATLAPTLWAEWPSQFPPFMLRTRGHEVLVGHPHPPGDFVALPREHGVWARLAKDTDVQATYRVNGVLTAVMSAPGASDDPSIWVLKAAHEVFHCYQGGARIRDPFVGKFAVYDDLSFPYPYEDPNQTAALRLEAEVVFRLATADANDSISLVTQGRLLPLVWRIQRVVSGEPAFPDYKVLTEWSEGVARYTERELARLAATPGRYRPAPSFVRTFPRASYDNVFREQYGDGNMVNPIRFVGEGVRGRTMFYYLGMGKAYALDRLSPTWRTTYAGKRSMNCWSSGPLGSRTDAQQRG
jgi:hypothetical protein